MAYEMYHSQPWQPIPAGGQPRRQVQHCPLKPHQLNHADRLREARCNQCLGVLRLAPRDKLVKLAFLEQAVYSIRAAGSRLLLDSGPRPAM